MGTSVGMESGIVLGSTVGSMLGSTVGVGATVGRGVAVTLAVGVGVCLAVLSRFVQPHSSPARTASAAKSIEKRFIRNILSLVYRG